jgi:threonyl-tRNA synthetase
MSISNSTNINLDTKRHSFAHLMAAAVGQMFPEAQYGVGPVIENGYYYDFVLPRNLIPEDLPLLENHIKDLLKRDLRFKVQQLSLEDAILHFNNAKQPLKVELLENLRDRGTTSMSEEEKADFGGQNSQNITIVKAEITDIKEIMRVKYNAMKSSFAEYGIDEADLYEECFSDAKYNQYLEYFKTTIYLIARKNDLIVAVAAMPNDSVIRTVWVDPEYQNQGIAKALLNKILEFGFEKFDKVSLSTGHQDKDRAIGFYKGFGFQATGKAEKIKLTTNQKTEIDSIEFELKKEDYLKSLPLMSDLGEVKSGDKNYTKLFEKVQARNLRRVNVGFVITNAKGEILFAKRGADKKSRPSLWHIPGGKMEDGENFEQAIKRELKEEFDLDLIKIKNFTNCTWNMFGVEPGNNEDEDTYYFEIEVKGDVALNYENTEYAYLDISKAQNLDGITKPELAIFENINKTNLPTITIYRIVDEKTGEVVFEDLCKGPHVWGVRVNQESVKDLNLQNMGFKLDKFSASYWRGDQARGINMQRLYALVFETKDELKAFVAQREEAKKRDHRVLNQTQKYFTISELVGAGLPLFQPNGMLLRKNIQNYLWQLHSKKGYKEVWTPHIAKEELYITSGHAAKFGDELFKVQGKTENFFMKPMNCPHHMQIFADNQFSYRDMPVRYFEHATVYRDEKPGQLSGFTRVRSITQDDGHLFCRVGQIKQEVSTIVAIIREFYDTIGMEASWVSLSVRDMNDLGKYLGGNEVWELAEKSLEEAAIENKLNYKRVEGEAAFYGPKLDFMFKDCMGREWQLATIQCDFNLPEKFDLSFVNEESEKERPVVIHRAISGSVERFLGVIIDNFAGKFPFWLAPEQIRILTINDEVLPFVDKIKEQLDSVVLMHPLKYNEVRYSVDTRMESLGKKIRESKLDKVPMFIVVGMKDVEEGIVSIEYAGESVKVPLGEVKVWMENVKN